MQFTLRSSPLGTALCPQSGRAQTTSASFALNTKQLLPTHLIHAHNLSHARLLHWPPPAPPILAGFRLKRTLGKSPDRRTAGAATRDLQVKNVAGGTVQLLTQVKTRITTTPTLQLQSKKFF